MPFSNCPAAELADSAAAADLLAALDWRRRLAAEMAAAFDADTVVVAEQSSHARGPEAVATIIAAGPGAAALIAALSRSNAGGADLTDPDAGAIALRLPPAEDGAGRRAAVAATPAGQDRLLWLAASRPRPAPDDLLTRLRQAVVWLPSLIAIGRPLDHVLAEWWALSDLFRRQPQPVMIADADGRLQRANRAAEALLADRDGLVLRDGRLRALCRDEDAALVEAVGANGPRAVGVRELVLSRPALAGKTAMWVCRPAPSGNAATASWRVIVVGDGGREAQKIDPQHLVHFGLTDREASIAALVAADVDLKTVARRRQITMNTLKFHLKNIYAKTGTRGKSELARLIAHSTPGLLNDKPDSFGRLAGGPHP